LETGFPSGEIAMKLPNGVNRLIDNKGIDSLKNKEAEK